MTEVHEESGPNRDGAPDVIAVILEGAVHVKKRLAARDEGGPKLQDTLKGLGVSQLLEMVPKPKDAKGLTV